MPMKAYACPRCLTLSCEMESGDGGAHTCTPSPFARKLEARVAELETWARKVMDETPASAIPCDLDLTILDPQR